ncbi:MAG TPA: Gfo/Idh/MocA family oxidoreductase, partial [Polyangiales bacterium]|nr:Gfo/Idh/MocA family oxidoreductase [Polyangiales bacterium]
LQAIHDTGNRLVAAVDPHDSVGVMDRYFPDARFFTEIERFDRHVERLRREKRPERVEYVTVCSPNYLQDSHCRLGLRVHADVICEKPLTINHWNIDALVELEHEFGQRVYTVLQLRLLPVLQELKRKLEADKSGKRHQLCLTYVTRRGSWYQTSWKGDATKSGGVAMNIGIHFFDLLLWLFGSVERSEVHFASNDKLAGFLELEHADVTWLLSVDRNDLPPGYFEAGNPAYRSLSMDGQEIEFSEGFTELHTAVYREILAGKGFGLADAKPSVELVYGLRSARIVTSPSLAHPQLERLRGGWARRAGDQR